MDIRDNNHKRLNKTRDIEISKKKGKHTSCEWNALDIE